MSYYYGNYGNLPEYKEEEEEQQNSCEILDTSRYVSGKVSSDDESSDEYDYDFDIQDLQSPKAAAAAHPHFDLTDPLRYCLEFGQITSHEYDKWKIVQEEEEEEEEEPRPRPQSQSKKRPDFGPGYNSDSDSDSDADADADSDADEESGVSYSYGNGYLTRLQHPHRVEFYDPWFPSPDPTPNKQYTAIATNPHQMMRQFVVFESDGEQPMPTAIPRLNHAFQLKLTWERFVTASNPPPQSPSPSPSLQTFWQTNALDIYEALQECVAIQAKCFNPLSGARKLIPDTPEFHTTPVEMLENTFETIGRMSRCIAEDFNTQSIVNYVDEFIHALYTELRFMALVERKIEILQGTESPVNPHRGLCPP
jgi:hypothetical protein